MRQLPNAISLARALCAVPVVVLAAPQTAALAVVIFSIAAVTDALDGPLARRIGATTRLGAFLDPLADKVLVLGALGGLLARDAVAALPVLAILIREATITSLRAFAAARGASVPSNSLGKAKAALQGAAVVAQLITLAAPSLGVAPVADALLWGAAALTVIAGIEVVQRAAAIGAPAGAMRAHAR